MVAKIILLCCGFHSIDPSLTLARKFIFFPIELKVFLDTLTGSNQVVNDLFKANPYLIGSRLSFSYFQQCGASKIVNPYEAMLNCFIHGSALNLAHCSPGADFLIPLILENGRISFLAVQVKLYRDQALTEHSFYPIYKKMKFTYFFEKCDPSLRDRTFASLILSLHNKIDDTKNEYFLLRKEMLTEPQGPPPKIQKTDRGIGIPEEVEFPPAIVIIGSSFGFKKQYKAIFEDFIYEYSPKINPLPGVDPEYLEQYSTLLHSIFADQNKRPDRNNSDQDKKPEPKQKMILPNQSKEAGT